MPAWAPHVRPNYSVPCWQGNGLASRARQGAVGLAALVAASGELAVPVVGALNCLNQWFGGTVSIVKPHQKLPLWREPAVPSDLP